MEQIDYDIDDFMTYCEVKNLSKKTINSYEQTLRLFAIFLKNECKVKEAGEVKEIHIREYIKQLQERGKYILLLIQLLYKPPLEELCIKISSYNSVRFCIPLRTYKNNIK